MDKLKGYKEQVLSKEKGDLAALRAQQAKYAAEQAKVQAELDEANEEFLRKSGSGMTIMEMTLFKEYLNSLSDQIRELERKIQLEEEKIKFQTKVVVEANKDVSSLEKLEDKQREEYNFKAAKAEEQFIEEYVSNSVYFKTANQC
ncbi:MAG: flagellar export protein FliJ [Ruminococcus sp.]|nr:flagellar export protein FliJ [Ruminococcus sp.]